jgi:hypothetical protein
MKSSNQGFIDLHTPQGFFLIGGCFLLFMLFIVIGGIYFKGLAAKEKEQRKALKESLQNKIQ